MGEPRKASDVLLSLEEKINTLVKVVSVYDLNTKLILDRVNKMYAYIQALQAETEAEKLADPQFKNYEPAIVQTSTDNIITIDENPIGQRRTARTESYPQQAPSQKHEKSNDIDKKIPVVQRVSDQTGKDLFMAEVSISNEQNELISKTKTNAVGKWQAYLKPGLYTVHIVKTDTATKKKIEAKQNITVSESNTTIVLPVISIRR